MLASTSLHWQHTLWLWLWAQARPQASVLSSHLLAGSCLSHQIYLHASLLLSLHLSTYVTAPVFALCLSLVICICESFAPHLRILVMSSVNFLLWSGHSNLKVVGFTSLSLVCTLTAVLVIRYTADAFINHFAHFKPFLYISVMALQAYIQLVLSILQYVNVVKGSFPNPFTWWCKHGIRGSKNDSISFQRSLIILITRYNRDCRKTWKLQFFLLSLRLCQVKGWWKEPAYAIQRVLMGVMVYINKNIKIRLKICKVVTQEKKPKSPLL